MRDHAIPIDTLYNIRGLLLEARRMSYEEGQIQTRRPNELCPIIGVYAALVHIKGYGSTYEGCTE